MNKRKRQSSRTPERQPSSRPSSRGTVAPQRPEYSGLPRQRAEAPVFGQNLWTGLQEQFTEPRSVETPPADIATSMAAGTTPLTNPSSLVFGQGGGFSSADIKDSHPQPVQAFFLWQTFLRNVNPLSKVIHAPQVQDLILQAADGFDAIPAQSLPLLFAIYAAAISSLTDEECQAKMGEQKKALLERYLTSTQQALAVAGFLRSVSLVILQAFTIFLLAARRNYDPNSMWILTGMAVRMGQRLQAAATNADYGSAFFVTQMRLRVWWQLMLIDGRVTQLSGQSLVFSADLPNYPLPENLNDSDIHPMMTGAPSSITDRPTEMIFCLLRYELGKFLFRHGKILHDQSASIARRDALIDELAAIFRDKYLRFIDPAIPLHQIAEGGARAAITKMRLMVHHPGQYPDKGKSLPQAEHDMLFATSVDMAEILVQGLTTTTLTHFLWHIDVYFQLDAIVFMLIESQSQPPGGALVDKAWQLVSDVFYYKPQLMNGSDELSVAVRQLVLRAWESREHEARKQALSMPTPPTTVATLQTQARQRKPQLTVNHTGIDSGDLPRGNKANATGSASGTTAAQELANTTAGSILDIQKLDCPGSPPSTNLDETPVSSYADMDVLGWETTDWDSWGYWNTLLQGHSV